MTVTTAVSLTPGFFVPLAQKVRGGDGHMSPVGTISQEITTVGDVSGGVVNLGLSDVFNSLGFRALYVPTYLSLVDGLAAVGAVEIQWFAGGNKRIRTSLRSVLTTVRVNSVDIARFEPAGVILEPDQTQSGTGARILNVSWPTNTDGITYRVQYFFAVYDAEDIERYGSISDLLAGVR